MAITELKKTYTFNEERVETLKQIVPEAFADGKINWNVLKELLGEHLEDDSTENFGLFWTGKRDARRLAAKSSKGTLIPCPGEGIDEETTENIFIEGDNLEVLKILRKSYKGRIKMIYIDPPYNTGNDFIYKDDYSEPLESYLRKTKQKDDEGNLLTTNPKSEGRFHSNWLNMMYPRLRIAKDLLRDDGVIFISIDDNEVSNLLHLMNEIFGEENFVSTIVWQKVFAKKNKAQISGSHDYIVIYTKNLGEWSRNLIPRDESQIEAFKNPDSDSRGLWQSVSFSVQSEDAERRKPYRYEITIPSGRKVLPPTGRHWGTLPDKYQDLVNDNRIWFGRNNDSPPRIKVFLSEVQSGIVPDTWWTHEESGNNQEAKKEVLGLLPEQEPFGTPKPTRLIMRMLEIAISSNSNDIVLDFFAGSGTTAHAVIKMNEKDKGNRQFICIQIPDKTKQSSKEFEMGYKTIADITLERIRRAIKISKNQLAKELDFDQKIDVGVKVYKLSDSSFRKWNEYEGKNVKELGELFRQYESALIDDWQINNVLTEITLIEGFPLSSNQIMDEKFERNKVYRISHAFNEHRLFVSLDNEIYEDTVETVAELPKQDIFICLDSALSDEAKISLADVCQIKTF